RKAANFAPQLVRVSGDRKGAKLHAPRARRDGSGGRRARRTLRRGWRRYRRSGSGRRGSRHWSAGHNWSRRLSVARSGFGRILGAGCATGLGHGSSGCSDWRRDGNRGRRPWNLAGAGARRLSRRRGCPQFGRSKLAGQRGVSLAAQLLRQSSPLLALIERHVRVHFGNGGGGLSQSRPARQSEQRISTSPVLLDQITVEVSDAEQVLRTRITATSSVLDI